MTQVAANLPRALAVVALGEDGRRQFKRDVHNGDSLASEMVAFANSEGGTIFIGVADDGTAHGLSLADVKRINQLISNTASQAVRSPIAVQTRNIPLESERVVIALTIPKGIDKPYFDRRCNLAQGRLGQAQSKLQRGAAPFFPDERSVPR